MSFRLAEASSHLPVLKEDLPTSGIASCDVSCTLLRHVVFWRLDWSLNARAAQRHCRRSSVVLAPIFVCGECVAPVKTHDGAMQDVVIEERLSSLIGSQALPLDFRHPDLLIRTGGEKRLSNFMLWDMAYSELHFCDAPWPSFAEDNFVEALRDYSRRKRSFGRRT